MSQSVFFINQSYPEADYYWGPFDSYETAKTILNKLKAQYSFASYNISSQSIITSQTPDENVTSLIRISKER